MKKLLTLLLASALLLSAVSCGKEANEDTSADTNAPAVEDTTPADETDAETEGNTDAGTSEETLAKKLLGVFNDTVNADSAATALQIAETVVGNENVPFGPVTMEMEPGYLNGFANYEVTGFESCAIFAPMIGSIPFVGYIFDLADDADVEAFKKGLTDNANLNWNVCVSADEMICESNGDKVFFVMAPVTFE